jgi:YaiO family outer membrane protein
MITEFKSRFRIIGTKFAVFLLATICACGAAAQDHQPLPQGGGLPGLGSLPGGMNGPGYLEFGGSHSGVSQSNPSWNDFYVRTMMSGGNNTLQLGAERQARWGASGWFFSGGLTRVLSENWFGELDFGTSLPGGFFLPKFRTDAYINRKLLSRKQLVTTFGFGYDKSKVQNNAIRGTVGAAYYLSAPWVLQGGVTFTKSNPGSVLTHTQYLAFTQGHDKEHFISVRGEYGREGYELIGPANGLFNFPIRGVSATWRQWVGFNWGFNAVVEHYRTPSYTRTGGTIGVFLDF